MPPPARAGAPPIRLLQVTTTVSTLDRFAMPPMLVAIAGDLDVALDAVVTAAGAYFLVYGLSQPAWGFASDRFGRVRTLRATLLLAGALTLVSAFSPTVLLLGVLRGLAGGFFGAAYPSALIYVGDTVAPGQRQHAVAGLMVGTALGTAAASAGAGLLADVASWRIAFIVTGLASMLLVVALTRLPEPARTSAPVSPLRSVGRVTRSSISLLVLVFAFAEGVVLLGALTLLPTAVESAGASATLAGGVTGVYGFAVLLGSFVVGRLSRHWHPSRLIAAGGTCAVGGTALLAASQHPAAGVAVAGMLGFAWTLMHSTLQTWATEVLPEARATIVSFFAGSVFGGSALGAVLVAGLADQGRFGLVYASYAALALPLGVVATWSRARWSGP